MSWTWRQASLDSVKTHWVDGIVMLSLFVLTLIVEVAMPVNQRDFFEQDIALSYPWRAGPYETVPNSLLGILAVIPPVLFLISLLVCRLRFAKNFRKRSAAADLVLNSSNAEQRTQLSLEYKS